MPRISYPPALVRSILGKRSRVTMVGPRAIRADVKGDDLAAQRTQPVNALGHEHLLDGVSSFSVQ